GSAPEGTRGETTEGGAGKKGPGRSARAAKSPSGPIVSRKAESGAARNATTSKPGTGDGAVWPPRPGEDGTRDARPERIA
ncbi:HAD-IB family hydrolase, partial [Mycobacterium tuberculosis]